MAQKIAVISILVAGFLIIAYEGYGVYSDYREMEVKREVLSAEAENIISENSKLQKNLDSLADPSVVIKELKSRFNYKLPGEKVIIVAPKREKNER